MNARRLLVLCYFYPPLAGGGVHRVLGFTRHLPALGWSCTVVCAGEEDYWVRDGTLKIPEGTEVIRVGGGSALSTWMRMRRDEAPGRRSEATFGALRRLSDWWLLPDSYAGWARRASRAGARRLERRDVTALLSSSPPDSVHLAGLDLARRFRVPWIADFRDPWVGLHFRTPPTAWHRACQQAFERRVLEGADQVLAASRTHAEQMARAMPDRADRIVHLPNGYEPRPESEASAGPADDPEKFLLVFTGTLAQMPDALAFLEGVHDALARRPEARRRLRVKLAGPFESGVEDRAVALGLRGIVEFLGPVAHAAARALQARADLLLLWKPSGEGYRTMVPGKLYEYLGSGRPILAVLEREDEAARLAADGGAVVVPARREAIAREIELRYAAWRDGARPTTTRPAWLEAHTRARLAAGLARTLERKVGA